MSAADVTNVPTRPRALVVFESMFGNTRAVARAVATGLGASMDVTTVEVGDAPAVIDEGIELLVVGGPTHAFGLSRTATRDSAPQRRSRPLVPIVDGLREWTGDLGRARRCIDVAAFDTKLRRPPLPGSAARAALRRLRRYGFSELGPTTKYWVASTAGPLIAGELGRGSPVGPGAR